MAGQRAATLVDVAHRAGVSLATASRVLNGTTRVVGEQLRARVLDAAAELRYTPNPHAQAGARGASNVVGLVVHDIADPYFSTIAAGVMRVAHAHRLVVTLGSTLGNPDRELEYVATMWAQRARALILLGSRGSATGHLRQLTTQVRAYRDGGGRVACVSQNRLGIDTVLPENRAGGRDLAAELVRLGHRRFAVLAGPPDVLTARDRLAGFRDGLTTAGLTLAADQVLTGPFTRDGGYAAADRLIATGLDATCVFAVNDVMAVGAMARLREAGVQVPTQLSVAGFDDIPTLRDVVPALTTVRLPLDVMGEQVARMVLDDPAPERPRLARVRGELVLRESTAAPRSNGSILIYHQ